MPLPLSSAQPLLQPPRMGTWPRLQNRLEEGEVAVSAYDDSAVTLVLVLHPRPHLLRPKVNMRLRLSTCWTLLVCESAQAVEVEPS
jgi:hypothetical protein